MSSQKRSKQRRAHSPNHNQEKWNNLFSQAVHFHQHNQLQEEIGCYQEIIRNEARVPDRTLLANVYFNLGNALSHAASQQEEAITAYDKAIQLRPGFGAAYNNLSLALKENGNRNRVHAVCRQGLAACPDEVSLLNNFAILLKEEGQQHEAIHLFRRATELEPQNAQIHFNIGNALASTGAHSEALTSYLAALELQQDNRCYAQAFIDALDRVPLSSFSQATLDGILHCFTIPHLDKQGICNAALHLLRNRPDVGQLLHLTEHTPATTLDDLLHNEATYRALTTPLLLSVLEQTIITAVDFEKLFTLLRRSFLQLALAEDITPGKKEFACRFLCALAIQNFHTDFVLYVRGDEHLLVEQLEHLIGKKLDADNSDMTFLLLLYAAYKPLSLLPAPHISEKLLTKKQKSPLFPLLQLHLDHSRVEREIQAQLPQLTPIRNEVSLAVRAQYEEHPYPRWQGLRIGQGGTNLRQKLQNLFPGFATELVNIPEAPDILIAGCGTGRHPLERAVELPSARFLGIDLSRASLAYGTRKARELGISNIRFMQADILELTDSDARFDCIESVGVLHHIEDPLRGWQNLVALLNPGGVMKIGLYSRLARVFVTEARQRIAAAGYTASIDDIRRFRWELLHAADQTTRDRFCRVKDFFTLPECRDLYFHAQEHQFSLRQIEEILDTLSLRFLGFEAIMPSLLTDFRARFPEDPRATDLRNWHQYELEHPDLFVNMYQFWVSKK